MAMSSTENTEAPYTPRCLLAFLNSAHVSTGKGRRCTFAGGFSDFRPGSAKLSLTP